MGCVESKPGPRLDTLHYDGAKSKRKKNIFKVVLLGDSSVGKTCLLRRFVRQDFSNDYKATIGADFLSKDIDVDGCQVTLQIWDTAGQERFHSLGVVFYRGADACGLVCDVTTESSLDSLEKWREEFGAANSDTFANNSNQQSKQSGIDEIAGVPCLLFANKCDVDPDKRILTKNELSNWCDEHGNMKLYETSALTGQGVEDAFYELARRLLKNAAPKN